MTNINDTIEFIAGTHRAKANNYTVYYVQLIQTYIKWENICWALRLWTANSELLKQSKQSVSCHLDEQQRQSQHQQYQQFEIWYSMFSI